MTPFGPAAIALGFAVFANYEGAYPNDKAEDGIEYLEMQPSLHSGGCSGRCLYGMWQERYPSIELGATYNGDDPTYQALMAFDPFIANPQARECLHVPIERRPWGNRPGRGGYVPGPQPGCKDNGDIDYPPVSGGISEDEFQRRQRDPVKLLPKWTPHEMPHLRSEHYNFGPFADYVPESRVGVNSPPNVLYTPDPPVPHYCLRDIAPLGFCPSMWGTDRPFAVLSPR